MSLEITIDSYADEQQVPLFELFGSYFPPHDRLLTATYTRWLYAANPFGLARMVKVVEGERWVGFMALVPVDLGQGGERLRAYYVVNVLVHPAFYGKHLFGRMITAAKALVDAEGAALMGHPNDMALKSWQRARMHFHEPLRPSLVWPLPWLPGLSAHTVEEASPGTFQACTAALAQTTAQATGWRVTATPDYLAWRYLGHPSHGYTVQLVENHGVPIGVQVSKRVRPGIRLLLDQFVPTDHARRALHLLPAFTLCFLPDSATKEMRHAVWALPWKKRLPFFFTLGSAPATASGVARIGLSASDF